MNSASEVARLISGWIAEKRSSAEIVWLTAQACMSWPYAWGALGQECTTGNRKACMNRSAIAEGDKELIRKRCQILNGSDSTCNGCKYYPEHQRTRLFDCRGFTRWCIQQAGVTISGGGATSQYNTASNWTERGLIKDMPRDKVCCVFQKNPNSSVMEHTGLALGDQIIHCSVEVKVGHTYDKGWTHYAVPKGIDGEAPVPAPTLPTLRKGSSGAYVTLAQTKLIQLGYDLSPYGPDGKFGNKTLEAVKAFQRDNGLNPDGIIGSKTWAALESGQPAVKYTVTIPHLSFSQADALIKQFGGEMTEERG